MLNNYSRGINEDEVEYTIRICDMKAAEGLTWNEIGEILNTNLNQKFTESKYRKFYQYFTKGYEKKQEIIATENGIISELDIKKQELYKQQVKTRDTFREYRTVLRNEARKENLLDHLDDKVKSLPSYKLPVIKNSNNKKEAILILSDWHIGAMTDNFYNKFNLDIAIERIAKIKNDTIEYCKLHNVDLLNVVNLADNIEGALHASARVESEMDSIDQVLTFTELLSQLLNDLSKKIPNVIYRDVIGNHDRAIQNYKDSIEDETFVKLTRKLLTLKLKDTRVKLEFNNIDMTMTYFTLRNGKNFAFAHGDKDKVNTAFQTFTSAFDKVMHYMALGHTHTSKAKEFNGSKVFVNGSLMGVNGYAKKNRYFSKPSQTLLVFDGENELDLRINFPKN